MVGFEEEIIDKDFRQSYWLALQFWVQPNRIFTVGVPQAFHGIILILILILIIIIIIIIIKLFKLKITEHSPTNILFRIELKEATS